MKTLFATAVALVFISCTQSAVKPKELTKMDVLPAKILDLTNWKTTIPFDANGKDGSGSGVAQEIKRPEFDTYTLPGYYFVNDTRDGVVFQAHAGGAHTSGSGYPRSELREMINNGKDVAKWQSGVGTHTMEIEQAITALPAAKKHVVAGQIHSTGDFDDVITCRLEDKKLLLSHNGRAATVLTTTYALGTRFKMKWVVENNVTKSYYNDQLVETYALAYPDSYFKAGCYTQSASWGKNNNHNASPSNFGEVVIYKITVDHK